MAYGYRPRRRSRRSFTSRRPRANRVRRRSTRKAPYRPRRMMSKRRILNVTSRKKQDNMLSTRSAYDGSSGVVGGALFSGNTRQMILYSPSMRDKQSGDPTSKATRETDTIFARGFKESINMQSLSSASWRWRRIVFAFKGILPLISPGIIGLQTSNGYVRAVPDYSSAAAATSRNVIEALIFRGTAGVDWINPLNAKLDTTRITVLHDRMRTLNSGNQSGRFFKHNQWYPINKNIVYNNDESGEIENTVEVSTQAKPGIGDILVLDYFDCASGLSTDQFFFEPECTFYWHEK